MTPLRIVTYTYLLISSTLAFLCIYLHYVTLPHMKSIAQSKFIGLNKHVKSWTTKVFVPLMILEIIFLYLMIHLDTDKDQRDKVLFGYFMIALWVITYPIILRIHKELNHGKNEKLLIELMRLNMIRILLWSIKSFLLLLGIIKYF